MKDVDRDERAALILNRRLRYLYGVDSASPGRRRIESEIRMLYGIFLLLFYMLIVGMAAGWFARK